MNKDFWERMDRLEELARKATQGEWYPEYPQGYDIEFIAAANPAMILEMVHMLKLQKKYLNFCDEALEKYNG